MIGQCVECGDVADSFRLLTWADIVKSYQSKSCTIFKDNFEKARARHRALMDDPHSPLPWLPEAVHRHSTTGIRVSAWYKCVPDDDYTSSFGILPPQSRLHNLMLEDGATMAQGLLVPRKPGGDVPELWHCRDVEVFRQYSTDLQKKLLIPEKSLREAESSDVAVDNHKMMMKEQAKARFGIL